MKHLQTFESFTEPTNEDARTTDSSLKEYVGKTIKAILEDEDGENSYVTIKLSNGSQIRITAYPTGGGGVGMAIE
jgi:hypothetical protein